MEAMADEGTCDSFVEVGDVDHDEVGIEALRSPVKRGSGERYADDLGHLREGGLESTEHQRRESDE
jgi:hypothetical protein